MYITSKHKLISVTDLDIHNQTFIIPPDVVEIGSNAFKNLPDLKELVIPASVKEIHQNAIQNTGIVHLVIPATVENINQFAFSGNEQLTTLEIINPNTKFNGSIVHNCRSLTTVKIGAIRHNVKCLKFGVAYKILNKKNIDVYTVYSIEPFKGATNLGRLYAAVKAGVVGDGATIKRAIADCDSLYLTPDIIQKYKDITLDTRITNLDYKRITGACDEGVIYWTRKLGFKSYDTLTVRELIKILEEQNVFGIKVFAQFIADRYKDRMEARRNGEKK